MSAIIPSLTDQDLCYDEKITASGYKTTHGAVVLIAMHATVFEFKFTPKLNYKG